MEETCEIGIRCFNCWMKDKIKIEKGKMLEPYSGLKLKSESHIGNKVIICKNCGLADLHVWIGWGEKMGNRKQAKRKVKPVIHKNCGGVIIVKKTKVGKKLEKCRKCGKEFKVTLVSMNQLNTLRENMR